MKRTVDKVENKYPLRELSPVKSVKIQEPSKNALVVLGHGGEAFIIKNKDGSENLEQITVPEGSLLVIKTHSGDITTSDISVPNYIDALTKENEKYILDPLNNIKEITKLFGSVAIYKPGEKCPNIYHSYLANHDASTGFSEGVSIEQSGIITVPVNPPMSKEEATKFVETSYEFPPDKTLSQYLQDLQNKKGPDIRSLLQHHLKNIEIPINGKTSLERSYDEILAIPDNNNKTLVDISRQLAKKTGIHQVEIFKKYPNSITYAFNCRFISGHGDYVSEKTRLGLKSDENINKVITVKPGTNELTNVLRGKKLNSSSVLTQKRENNTTVKRNTSRVKGMAAEIKQQISEGAIQRRNSSIARSNINKSTDKIPGLLKEYDDVLEKRLYNDPTYKQRAINMLKKEYPELEHKYYNKLINKPLNKISRSNLKGLNSIKNNYRKNNVTKRRKIIYNKYTNINDSRDAGKLIEKYLVLDPKEKDTDTEKLKIEQMLVDFILKTDLRNSNIILFFEFLHAYRKTHPENQEITMKLNEFAIQIFEKFYYKLRSLGEKKFYDKKLIHNPEALIALEKLIIDYILSSKYPSDLSNYIFIYDNQDKHKEKQKEIRVLLSNLTNKIYTNIYKTDKKNTLTIVLGEIPELREALEKMDTKKT